VEGDGFEPPYGKPGQIYSLLQLTALPSLHIFKKQQKKNTCF
jgi:hypothetical protein